MNEKTLTEQLSKDFLEILKNPSNFAQDESKSLNETSLPKIFSELLKTYYIKPKYYPYS